MKKMLIIVVIGLLSLSVSANENSHKERNNLMKELNLTKEQKQELKILKRKNHNKMKEEFTELKERLKLDDSQKEELKSHWQNAMQQAAVIQRTSNQGKLPAGIIRQLQEISQSQIDWRSYLWRYLVQTPNDFQGYDRRFVGRGLYLDTVAGESVQVFVCVDSSGSIGDQQLKLFLSEVVGIL